MGQEQSTETTNGIPSQNQAHNGFPFCSGLQQCCDALTEDNFDENFKGQKKGQHILKPSARQSNRGIVIPANNLNSNRIKKSDNGTIKVINSQQSYDQPAAKRVSFSSKSVLQPALPRGSSQMPDQNIIAPSYSQRSSKNSSFNHNDQLIQLENEMIQLKPPPTFKSKGSIREQREQKKEQIKNDSSIVIEEENKEQNIDKRFFSNQMQKVESQISPPLPLSGIINGSFDTVKQAQQIKRRDDDEEEEKKDQLSQVRGKSKLGPEKTKEITEKPYSIKNSNHSVTKSEEKKGEQNGFVQIDADSNELSRKEQSRPSQKPSNKLDSDRVSFSRAVSQHLASHNGSIESSMKGTRWSFGNKLEQGARFIFMPQESIKVKYRVLQMVQATAYGDILRIQIQQKPPDERRKSNLSVSKAVPACAAGGEKDGNQPAIEKSAEKQSEVDLKKRQITYFPEIYTLTTVQQSKFNKEEKKFILRQALDLTNLAESLNVSKIDYMYKSANMFFFITKEPTCLVSKSLMTRIESKRTQEVNRVTEQIQKEEQFKMPIRPPNLFEYIINRGKTLNLADIQVIARDLLLCLHQIHSKGIAHLDLQPLNILVIDNIERQCNESSFDMSHIIREDERVDSAMSESVSQYAGNRRFIHLTNFCISSGFLRKKFSSNLISSLYFMSPERICGNIDCENAFLAAKADVWSLGVILFLLVFGKPPFDGRLTTSLVKSIKNGNVKLKDNNWSENLQLFIQFITEMLRTGPIERISVIGALNHEFFRRDYADLQKLSFKRSSLQNLEDFWKGVMLKNEIKNFAQFMASCIYPSSMMERIFEEKEAQNIKQVLNGLSYITDDLTLARFIVEEGFPDDFNDQSNQNPDCPHDLKINASNVCNYFLSMYQKVYEGQMVLLLQYFLDKRDNENQIKVVQKCIMHALCVRELNPTLNDLTMSSFCNVILGQQINE